MAEKKTIQISSDREAELVSSNVTAAPENKGKKLLYEEALDLKIISYNDHPPDAKGGHVMGDCESDDDDDD